MDRVSFFQFSLGKTEQKLSPRTQKMVGEKRNFRKYYVGKPFGFCEIKVPNGLVFEGSEASQSSALLHKATVSGKTKGEKPFGFLE
jgi:hypothetical protein